MEDQSNKRKRDLRDTGDREQKKPHVEDRKLGIEDLHLDVGKKYLLCRTRKKPPPFDSIAVGAKVPFVGFNLYLLHIIYN
jgi:hypothetical protein